MAALQQDRTGGGGGGGGGAQLNCMVSREQYGPAISLSLL